MEMKMCENENERELKWVGLEMGGNYNCVEWKLEEIKMIGIKIIGMKMLGNKNEWGWKCLEINLRENENAWE